MKYHALFSLILLGASALNIPRRPSDALGIPSESTTLPAIVQNGPRNIRDAPPSVTPSNIRTGAPAHFSRPPTTLSTTHSTTRSTTRSTTASATTSQGPIVTDQAYIDTILRHHNVHRANNSVNPLTWSPSLAATAKKIAELCLWQHNTTIDGGGYGQNLGAGYPSTLMGDFITDGLYNGEISAYTYYGGEPDFNTLGSWGHYSAIVWKGTTTVGCYTYDCTSKGGLIYPPNPSQKLPAQLSVCNYSPSGNVVGQFAANVLKPLGHPTIYGNYGCPSESNCVNS